MGNQPTYKEYTEKRSSKVVCGLELFSKMENTRGEWIRNIHRCENHSSTVDACLISSDSEAVKNFEKIMEPYKICMKKNDIYTSKSP
jgi:hypothetical protein